MTDYSNLLSAHFNKINASRSLKSILGVSTLCYGTTILLFHENKLSTEILAGITIFYVAFSAYLASLIKYHFKADLYIRYIDSTLHIPKLFKGIKVIDLRNLKSTETLANEKDEFGVLIEIENKTPFLLQRRIFKNEDEYFIFSKKLTQLANKNIPQAEHDAKSILSKTAKYETLTLSAFIAVLVYLYLISSYEANFLHITDSYIYFGSNEKGILGTREYYRLFTASFLHIHILHLLLNVFILAVYGQFILRTLGIFRFILILLLAALSGTFFSNLFSPTIYSIGISGGLYGLIGAYLFVKMKYGKLLPASINSISTKVLISLLIADLVSSIFIFENIDFTNHIFGFLSGLLYCYLARIDLITQGSSSLFERISCALLGFMYASSLVYLFILL